MNQSPRPSPQEREAALFALALEKPVAERAAFLQAVCGKDSALRQRLEALLAAHEQPDELLGHDVGKPTVKATTKLEFAEEPADETVGQTLGRYKLLERVGEGGCGVVYVAEQTQPVRRRVALKVIKLGMDTKQVVARFEAERQALAMMDHPNIAKVLDAGTTDVGRPYFVMELVRGIRITDYCDQANLTTKERLDLFIKVCQAVQHAHQKGIIHRDIKPSNILVTLHDGVPVPKVIDFGIAKATEGRLTDNTVYTQLHQFIGTPAYMSPEQAEMSGLDIDTRSDIYSLGVLLYELLAGSTPFDAKELMASGIDAMRKTIREQEPQRPSTRLATLGADQLTTTAKRRSADTSKLLHQLKGDLDWIVMKCLEKDRTRRYETANGLAADINRHLNNEPVLARPPSAAYKFQKAFRRNKLVFTAATAVAVALILGVIGTTVGLLRAEKQRHAAEEARRLAEQRFQSARQFVNDVFQKVEPEYSKLIGASKAREALARISVTFVESLGDPKQSDEAFQNDLAELYLRLADALGEPFGENSLGDYEAALRFANQSLALWRDLARKDTSNFQRQRKIGILEQRAANILWALGRYEEAKPLFQSSLNRSEAGVKVDPDYARATRNLSISHWHVGGVLKHEGRVRQALEEHYLPYSKVWLERPLAPPETIDEAHMCYVAHVLVGDALLELGRAEEALPHLEKSFQWVKIKLEMDPNNARAARDRIELLSLIGAAQLALGQTEPGAQSLDEAVRHADALVARDPANGPAQLQFIDALQAQAKGFATQANLAGIAPARQVELWQHALQTLARCQQRMDSPELRQRKTSLEAEAKKTAQAMNEARAALAKIAAGVGSIPPTPAKDKPETKSP